MYVELWHRTAPVHNFFMVYFYTIQLCKFMAFLYTGNGCHKSVLSICSQNIVLYINAFHKMGSV